MLANLAWLDLEQIIFGNMINIALKKVDKIWEIYVPPYGILKYIELAGYKV